MCPYVHPRGDVTEHRQVFFLRKSVAQISFFAICSLNKNRAQYPILINISPPNKCRWGCRDDRGGLHMIQNTQIYNTDNWNRGQKPHPSYLPWKWQNILNGTVQPRTHELRVVLRYAVSEVSEFRWVHFIFMQSAAAAQRRSLDNYTLIDPSDPGYEKYSANIYCA